MVEKAEKPDGGRKTPEATEQGEPSDRVRPEDRRSEAIELEIGALEACLPPPPGQPDVRERGKAGGDTKARDGA